MSHKWNQLAWRYYRCEICSLVRHAYLESTSFFIVKGKNYGCIEPKCSQVLFDNVME